MNVYVILDRDGELIDVCKSMAVAELAIEDYNENRHDFIIKQRELITMKTLGLKATERRNN